MAKQEPLSGEILQTPPGAVLKQDRRSRVWRVDSPRGPLVIKRFEYAPWRQWFGRWLGIHPAQREIRCNDLLREQGFHVVPIVAADVWPGPWPGRSYLATPWIGPSLQGLLRSQATMSPLQQRKVAQAVGTLAGRLIRRDLFFKDLKTSNLLWDEQEQGRLWLIDVGATRRLRGRGQMLRMLAMLDRTAAADGASRTNRLRALRAAVHTAGLREPWKELARAVVRLTLQ